MQFNTIKITDTVSTNTQLKNIAVNQIMVIFHLCTEMQIDFSR